MLQARMRDMLLQTPNGDITDTYSLALYYEPGFDPLFPLEFEFPRCDRFSLRIRKRSNAAGTTFSNIDSVNMSVTVKDPTNGRSVPYTLTDDDATHIILTITNALTLNNPVVRTRIMDVYVKDSTDNDFLFFRILVDDQDKVFHYIPVAVNDIHDRNSVTAQGRDVSIKIKASSDYYILFSPYAYLKESTFSDSDFSYPLNTIFYKRQDSYNNEDYSFSISSYSHAFMRDVVSVMNIPSYHKAGVLLVDNRIYKDIIEGGESSFVQIAVVGEISGISDMFKVNFTG